MIRKSMTAALALSVLAGSALVATTAPSLAGGKHFHGHHKHHKIHRHVYGYGYGYHPGGCFIKKVKVHGYYGWHWKKVRVCY